MPFEFNDSYEASDDIPVEFRSLYNETDEGFAFDAERHAGVRKAYLGKDRALKKARAAENGNIAKHMEPLSEFGETPDAILSTFQERIQAAQDEARENALAESKGASDETVQKRIDKLRNDLTTVHQEELEKRDATAGRYRAQLEGVLGKQAALAALAGKALDPELALPFVMNHLKTVETDDGSLRVIVVDEEGLPRENLVTSDAFTIADLVEELGSTEKYAPLFRSEAPKGGGALQSPRPTAGVAASKARQQRANMTPLQKISAGLKKGQASKGN